ncbi:MAG: rRNA maturation RNase YbeY [Gemmatimonadaceae bacterium]|nr:rRNA maturation RNase YbeY [Gemmatimonadaceae bacterium]
MRSDDPPQRRSRTHPGRVPAKGAIQVEVTSEIGRSPLSRVAIGGLARHVLRAERIPRAHLAIHLVTVSRIARLHREFVGRHGPTDIVTLEHARSAAGAPVVGEISIAPAVAAANAAALGIPAREEIARLVVHGVLHALGWDHPETAARTRSPMWRRQETLLRSARRQGVFATRHPR